ncbi:MAG: J domain-containing protein [Haloarculaceae archaeon]
MYGSRIVSGLAVVFGVMAALFAVFAVVFNPVFLAVAAVFGAAAYFVWYHASGRFARRLYQGVEQQAQPTAGRGPGQGASRRDGSGAGPREEWVPPRDGAGGRSVWNGARVGPRPDGITAREAYDRLGLDADADADAVKRAYREKVKEVHPDTEGGDEDAFKRVKTAYERLDED